MTVIEPSPQTPGRVDWIINCTLYKILGPDKSFFLTSPKQGFASSCYTKGVAWFWGEEIMGNPISNIDQA